MDIYKNAVKELVMNPGFRKWVLYPNPESERIWRNYLAKNPTAVQDVEMARELLLELFSPQYPLEDSEFNDIWDYIDVQTEKEDNDDTKQKIIPINYLSQAKRDEKNKVQRHGLWSLSKIASILIFVIVLGLLGTELIPKKPFVDQTASVKLKEYSTPPGVKSTVTLADGTKVMLNSGSLLRYQENFPSDKREVFLEGEAFFEVYHDPERPFTVKAGDVSTTALGTSFNIMAYERESLLI